MTSLFISASDIKEHRDVCIKTAYLIFNKILKKFDLPKERELSLKSYCEYYNLKEERVYEEMVVFRKPKKNKTKP